MRVSEYIPHGIAGVSAVFAVFAFQQSSELSVADYAERIRSNELSIQSSAERLQDTASDLEKLAERIQSAEDKRDIQELRSAVSQLQTEVEKLKQRPVAAGTGASAEEVAAVLARDYAEELRGPAGPKGAKGERGLQGEQGPKGEAGSAGSGVTGQARGAIVIDASFSSNYEEKYVDAVKLTLLGCSANGPRAECALLLEQTGGGNTNLRFWSQYSRAALPSAEWVQAASVTIGGSEPDNFQTIDLVSGIPTKISFEFNLPSAGHDGLLALEIGAGSQPQLVTWKNVVLE